ncbi:hypothetical protein PM082_024457 [Marasmius tenuissimus]|nr:hypothetical protein PM082_024457 [Marasmius tenuissimus]
MPDLSSEYPRRIVVDDTDPRITYDTGTWNFDVTSFDNFGVLGRPYNETLRGTNSDSASFTFTFQGEYVQIRGAKDNSRIPPPPNSTLDQLELFPKYTCQVDGRPIPPNPYKYSKYMTTNLVLCEGSHLSKTNHTISMNISVNNPDTQTFWLDSIEYAAPDGVNLTNSVVKVDSRDTSCVYHNNTGSWQTLSGDISIGDSNVTGVVGGSMSFKFNVLNEFDDPTGTSVSLYGVNLLLADGSPLDSATGSYNIDSGGLVTFDIPQTKRFPLSTDNNFSSWSNQRFFSVASGLDGSKEHEILITYSGIKNGTGQGQSLSVDYSLVGNDSSQVSEGPSDSGGQEDHGNHGSGKPIGAIVGGVVGGVFGLFLIVGLAWFVIKKRRKQGNAPSVLMNGEPIVMPFNPMAETGEPLRRDSGAFGTGFRSEGRGPEDARRANFVGMKRAQREVVSQQASRERYSGSRYSGVTGSGSSAPPGSSIGAPPIYTP